MPRSAVCRGLTCILAIKFAKAEIFLRRKCLLITAFYPRQVIPIRRINACLSAGIDLSAMTLKHVKTRCFTVEMRGFTILCRVVQSPRVPDGIRYQIQRASRSSPPPFFPNPSHQNEFNAKLCAKEKAMPNVNAIVNGRHCKETTI